MVLITGASGLVGSHLAQALIAKGKSVRAIYRRTVPAFPGSEKIEWVEGDVLDVVTLTNALIGITEVYHCAAVVSFSPKKVATMMQINVTGTANLVNACLEEGIQKLVHVSSVAALGRIREGLPIDESMNWTAETSNSQYGKSKYLAEREIWRGIAEGLNAVMVNPVIILGAGDWNKGSSEIFKSAYHEFPWYTSGSSGFVDVQDLVTVMIALMESPIQSERFIICSENLPYQTVFTEIAQLFQKRPPYKKASPFLSGLVWRLEAIKGWITGKDPMLTRETAKTANAKVNFKNDKIIKALPGISFQPVRKTLERVCSEFKQIHSLN